MSTFLAKGGFKMYNQGDIIVYTTCGLCRIDGIIDRVFNGEEKKYYILKPINDNRATLQVQVDNPITEIKLKTLLSKNEINDIINEVPNIEPFWIDNENERKKVFSEIIRNGDRLKIYELMISIIEHSKGLKDKGRKLHACDETYLNDARKLICEEISYVLDMSYGDAVTFLTNIIGDKE